MGDSKGMFQKLSALEDSKGMFQKTSLTLYLKKIGESMIELLLSEHFFWLKNVIRTISLLGFLYVLFKCH